VGSPRNRALSEPSASPAPATSTPPRHARDVARAASGVRLRLLEPRHSAHAPLIERAARVAGLTVDYVEQIEALPPHAALVGVGPSVPDPLQVARRLRLVGAEPLLVFFTSSSSARDALRAELIRDPFLYPRYELVDLPQTPRELASRMGRVVAQVESQRHARPKPRRLRGRSLAARSRPAGPAAGDQFLAGLVANARDAIFATDTAARVVTWNAAAQRLFGFSAEAAVGRRADFLDAPAGPDSPTQIGTILRDVLASGEPQHAHVTCLGASGQRVDVALSVAPVRDARGALLGVSAIARDDSEYQRVEQAVREVNRQKDEFLAIMSHELRTPLTSILGYTDMLLRGLSGPLPPLTNRYIGNVRSAGDRLLELVNGLLDYTRLEAGVERLNPRPVALSRIVGQVVEHFQPQARAKDIELRLAIARGVPARIDADEDKLVHVLRSYISNALKFTPNGGWVAVYVGPDPEVRNSVRVSVVDSGIGMHNDQIARVWERFYQGDASLTRPYGGMGLGLSIARHLVTLHGGSVGADSRGPDRGSTFWFTLPVRQTGEPARPDQARRVDPEQRDSVRKGLVGKVVIE
jgi:PAS domain S-box-containing protein